MEPLAHQHPGPADDEMSGFNPRIAGGRGPGSSPVMGPRPRRDQLRDLRDREVARIRQQVSPPRLTTLSSFRICLPDGRRNRLS